MFRSVKDSYFVKLGGRLVPYGAPARSTTGDGSSIVYLFRCASIRIEVVKHSLV